MSIGYYILIMRLVFYDAKFFDFVFSFEYLNFLYKYVILEFIRIVGKLVISQGVDSIYF